MSAEDQSAVSDATEQTEPQEKATEQTESYAEALLKMAQEDGHEIGVVPPKEEAQVEGEPETLESEVPATEPEPEVTAPEPAAEPEPEEEKPEELKHPGDKLVPLREVMAERDKKKRANERAEKAEAESIQLKAALEQAMAPRPTEDDPFRDIVDMNALERLERSYEKAIDLADENPDGAIDVVIGKNPDGSEKRMDFTPEKLLEMRRKAEKAVRKFIPERRTYLQQRAVADQQAAQIYPELKDPNSEFTQAAGVLAYRLMTGEAMKAPDVLVWIARAVKGYQMEQERNGDASAKVKTPEAKRIVQSAQQQIAPTPTRSRSFVERGTRSVSLEKANKKFEERGDAESAEEVVAALLSQKGGSKRLEPLG